MMKKMTSQEVVDTFLEFFEKREHTKIPGHSLAPDNDPSLLFINSGMAPLKPYFLGKETPPTPNLTNVQRCIRTNDIEEVGDRHHLTFFEMMGSWSIGNYWKEDAIKLAWELLTQGFGFPPERLFATVYQGNEELGIPPDTDSIKFWKQVGMPDDHIVAMGQDNFWGPAGEFGPCGPCTEVFFDTGEEYGETYVPGGHFDDVNRYIEIWNAGVFMEYNKVSEGMTKLEKRSVDTGSGVERITMTINGDDTVYETDLLAPLVEFAAGQMEGTAKSDKSVRLISDHMRSTVMLIADGVEPSNTGAGYIPRRLIRRAIAAAYQKTTTFDFAAMLDIAIANAGSWNPHVAERKSEIQRIFKRELTEFESTLETGMKKMEDAFSSSKGKLSGDEAFKLFATYGLPVDTIREYFLSKEGSFDEEGFQTAFAKHQELSRASANDDAKSAVALDLSGLPETQFLGYEQLENDGSILALFKDGDRVDNAVEGDSVLIVADATSFYREGGGQVGDIGEIATANASIQVSDVSAPENGVYLHKGSVVRGNINTGDNAKFTVDGERRSKVQANHTATHLLHSALRRTLGDGVGQAGSLVNDERLRFDFTYTAKITDEEIEQIEALVNDEIRKNSSQESRSMSLDEATAEGALAFFGDKYGDVVRTVKFGDHSMELCGGTHVGATGEIGLLTVISEGSVARGVRRIQALTGANAFNRLRSHDTILQRISNRMHAKPENLEQKIEALSAQRKAAAANAAPEASAKALVANATTIKGDTQAVIQKVDVSSKQIRPLALDIVKQTKGIAALFSVADDKLMVTIAIHDSKTDQFNANDLLQPLLEKIGGRGGGKDSYASGGGPNKDALDSVMEMVSTALG